MPIIQTSEKHAKMLQVPPIGRYPAEITNVQYKPNKEKTGHNYVYSYTLRDETYNGKSIDAYYPASHDMGIANMLLVHKAITGSQDNNNSFDPEVAHKGALVVVELDHDMYKGAPVARIAGVLPKDTVLETPFD